MNIIEENIRKVSRMGLLERIKRGLPKMDFMNHKHEDCANFDNGTCKFWHFTNLDPKGQACPHFKPKNKNENHEK
jgi:hypothetical protein